MEKEIRVVYYDKQLNIETYHFKGIVQSFPNHFHEHYVIGFMEKGQRYLYCKNKKYTIVKDDIIIFNPNDNHACTQISGEKINYYAFNISKETMLNLVNEVSGKSQLPQFSQIVIRNEELKSYLYMLHRMVMNNSDKFEKEEYFLIIISLLINKYSKPLEKYNSEYTQEIESACKFMQMHYAEHIYLDEICNYVGISKSTLLRAFTKTKGITPYRYLQTIRINKAKSLLENGTSLIEAAIQTGFSDQSHFTNFFNKFIGLTPGIYRDIFLNKETQE